MTKFEYSDFYKFITSLGIALISFSFIVPWLFLREPFDLFQKKDDILLLTPVAQSIVAQRQATIIFILKAVPVFSFLSFVFGVLALSIGGIKWYGKTQAMNDRINELNVKLLEKQFDALSPTDVKARQEKDIRAELEENKDMEVVDADKVVKSSVINKIVEKAFEIERRLQEQLKSCFGDAYTILPDRKLGNVFFDIVMASKVSMTRDYLFEVKYIQNGFKYSWVRDNVQKLIYAGQAYQRETSRDPILVLFIVVSDSVESRLLANFRRYIVNLQKEIIDLDTNVVITYLREKDFYNMDCKTLTLKLNQFAF